MRLVSLSTWNFAPAPADSRLSWIIDDWQSATTGLWDYYIVNQSMKPVRTYPHMMSACCYRACWRDPWNSVEGTAYSGQMLIHVSTTCHNHLLAWLDLGKTVGREGHALLDVAKTEADRT